MSKTAGIGDPYWYEWTVGLGYIIEMLDQSSGIEAVTLQKSDVPGWDDVVVERRNLERQHASVINAARRRGGPGEIVIVCGLSGSGKSAVSREISFQLSAVHLRSDAIRKHLFGVPLTETAESLYTPEATAATYARMIDIAGAFSLSS